jgi:hypothetical protein
MQGNVAGQRQRLVAGGLLGFWGVNAMRLGRDSVYLQVGCWGSGGLNAMRLGRDSV